jgi:DNA-binding NtrC family response regulator
MTATVSMRNKADAATPRVLVAIADLSYATALNSFLESGGYDIELAPDAKGVLRLAGRRNFDVIVLDLGLDEDCDVELVSFVREHAPDSELIVLFEVSEVDRAIDAIRHGAFFYLPISGRPTDVAHVVNKAHRNRLTKEAMGRYEQSLFEELVGGTPAMKRVIEIIMKVAPTDSTVLLLGESGTGKEVLANAVHRLSRRADKPLVAVNCAALPEGLLESELFGHVKGAFTGAHADKRGLFEEADGGAIFLDEIGDMALVTQAKLLRVLQSGDIRPVGSTTTSRVDVRIIAATNRDLEEAVAEGRFREDLYFRLNVVQVRIPPLRERLEALPKLANHFLHQANESSASP